MQLNSFLTQYFSPKDNPTQGIPNRENNSVARLQTGDNNSIKSASFNTVLADAQRTQKNENSTTNHAPCTDDGASSLSALPRVSRTTIQEGIEIITFDMDMVLTPEDKKLLGWPQPDDMDIAIQQIACFIALDRVDNYLKGQVTQEYLIGNQNKAIPGLHQRSPEITKSAVYRLLEQLEK